MASPEYPKRITCWIRGAVASGALLLGIGVLGGPAVAAGRLYLRQQNAQGVSRIEALAPGQGLVQVVGNGRVLRSKAVDPSAPLRLIVAFDAEPAVTARLRRLDAARPIRLAEQFRSDLARLSASRATRAGAAPIAQVTRTYSQVFSGAAVTLAPELVAPVRALAYVRGVFPDDTVRASLEQSVPLIGADRVASQLNGTGAGIRVGIVDTGIDYDHPAFGGGFGPGHRVAGGYDFVSDDPDPRDDNGHGTHVAGIVGGNGGGVVGVATGATLYAFKVLTAEGWGVSSWILSGLDRVLDPDQNPATDDAMQVINLSLGSSVGGPGDPMSVALDHLTEAGVVCVVAAGNTAEFFAMGAPATSRLAITVGASDKQDVMAYFSTPGPVVESLDLKPDLVAPGVDIVSAAMGGGRVAMSGTSMAAPHVTGVVAQLRQLHPYWTTAELKAAVTGTAKDLGQPPLVQGAGRVDAWAAATASFLVTPTHLAFGRDDDAQPTWVMRDTLEVFNVVNSPLTVSLSAVVALGPGAQLQVAPASVSIPAGDSAAVVATLSVNNATTPFPADQPFAYTGVLTATAGPETRRVPISFHKAASLRVHSPDLLNLALVHDRRQNGFFHADHGTGEPFLLPPGNYDVMAWLANGFNFVVREGLPVSGETDLQVAASDADLHLEFSNVGPDGKPVDCNASSLSLHHGPTGNGVLIASSGGFQEIRSSALSSDYRLDWTRSRVNDPVSLTTFSGALSGVAASQVISNRPEDLTHFAVAFPRVPADSAALLMFQLMRFWGYVGAYFGIATFDPTTPPILGPFTYQEWVQLAPYPGHALSAQVAMLVRRSGGMIYEPQLIGPFTHLDRGWPLPIATFGFRDSTAFRFGADLMHLFGEAPVWQGRIANYGTTLVLYNQATWGGHPVSDMYGSQVRGPDPPFTLSRNGIVIESDTLRGAGGLDSIYALRRSLTLDAYDLDTSIPYVLAGGLGTLAVHAHFDTRLPDPDPPWLWGLQVFADGQATDSIAFMQAFDAGLRFRMMDGDTLCPTSVEVGREGSNAWTRLPVERQGDDWLVRFPPSLYGETALRLSATDREGNSLTMTWSPAFVAMPGSAQEITSLGADAAGGTVRLAWRVPASAGLQLDVERRGPSTGWARLGATTVDAAGVATYEDDTALPGQTYAYRLTIALGGSSQSSSEVWITVPARPELALAGTHPNPTPGPDFLVDFSLPNAAPATLALYDLAGRRLHAVEVGGLGVGRHVLRFVPPISPRPGIYFLRLTQGPRSLTSRMCLLR